MYNTQQTTRVDPGYSKIKTLFKRDEKFALTNEYSHPVFEIVDCWNVTEKIDGTNLRITILPDGEILFGGRTDRAQIQKNLLDVLTETFTIDRLQQLHDPEKEQQPAFTLYGEGFGANIQKVGPKYREDPSFILFDVLVGGHYWLDDDQVTEIADELGLMRAPIIGRDMRKKQIIELVRYGFDSVVAEQQLSSEGIIARPKQPLYDRQGKRVMFKLKTSDFKIPGVHS